MPVGDAQESPFAPRPHHALYAWSEKDALTVERFTSVDLPYIKRHALRALCGLLMNRHSECRVCPFCGDSDRGLELIVNASCYLSENGPLIGLYFRGTAKLPPSYDGPELDVISDWGRGVRPHSAEPERTAVVQPLSNGMYLAHYGKVVGTTKGDHSSGYLDTQGGEIEYICDPEPDWTQWQYWDSDITEKQVTVPEFLCKRLRGEWWILDRDWGQGFVQQVAGLRVADCPGHLAKA